MFTPKITRQIISGIILGNIENATNKENATEAVAKTKDVLEFISKLSTEEFQEIKREYGVSNDSDPFKLPANPEWIPKYVP